MSLNHKIKPAFPGAMLWQQTMSWICCAAAAQLKITNGIDTAKRKSYPRQSDSIAETPRPISTQPSSYSNGLGSHPILGAAIFWAYA